MKFGLNSLDYCTFKIPKILKKWNKLANGANVPLEHLGKMGKISKSFLLSVLTGSIISLRKENVKHVIADARLTTVLRLSREAPFSSSTRPGPKHSFWTESFSFLVFGQR